MSNFYQKLFTRSNADIPLPVDRKFRMLFKRPVSVEWMRTGTDFEALFYENEQEKIARFDSNGNLKETRINHKPLEFPDSQNPEVTALGIVMNFIEIRKEATVNYELILRKPDLSRLFVLLNDQFEIVRQEPL